MTSLRQRMTGDMQVRNLALNTQTCYVQQVSLFARHFDKSPEQLGPEDIRAYQVYLTNERKLATGSVLIAVAALRFLYKVSLKKDWTFEDVIPAPKKPQKLPVIPSPEEVLHFLGSVRSTRNRAILTACYAAGLRISECIHLKAADIDSRQMVIRIGQGKGHKDRYVMLSPKLLETLRSYWKAVRPKDWLFEGDIPGQPIQRSAATSSVAISVVMNGIASIAAGTGTAQNVSLSLGRNGSRTDKPNFWKSAIFTSSLPCHRRSRPSPYQNKELVLGILFRVTAETLRTIAADPKHLGAEIGFFAVLHTWGSNLQFHPHLHCVVPGGGLSPDGQRWVSCRRNFFLHVRVLSRLFKRLFLEALKTAFDAGKLQFFHSLEPLREAVVFARQLARMKACDWVVYAKQPLFRMRNKFRQVRGAI